MNKDTIARDLIKVGLPIIPVKNKIPTVQWKQYQERIPSIDELNYVESLGLVCGIQSQVEVIDVDTKNDSKGTLIASLTEAIFLNSPDISEKDLVIQRTPSGGCHLIYKCEHIEGNQILAKEKSGRVLIETRGIGGYVVISPSEGYELLSGSLFSIPTITIEQREHLFTACRSLNEYYTEVKAPKYVQSSTGLTPWDDYNQREQNNIPSLLEKHGWTYIKTIGENQHFCRPDKKGTTSGTFNGQTFYCFTSSTILEPSEAYSASALFTYLECNKDFSEAARRLYSLGYGERLNSQHTNTTEVKSFDWKALQIVSEPPEETPLLSIGSSPIATAGNYSQIIGKKKSRKSLFITWMISQYMGDQSKDVILFDTEQGTRHVWKVMDRIKRLTGYQVGTFYLRGKSPSERKAIIETVVKEYPSRPKIIIIDGIRDLLSNINDPDQVSELLTWLEKLTLDHSLHVVNVLHMNKTDNNARGHLGSELLNKSEITIELERDEKADCTIVKCESSRDIPFESFAFRHSIDGLPEIVGLPTAGKVLPDEEIKNRLRFAFQDTQQLKHGELVKEIREHFEVGRNKALSMVKEFARNGWIVKNGLERSSNALYKCMV